jgi:chromosome segregation ATPase
MAQIEQTVEELARLRDELRLQIHLASAETKTEWEKLEKRWQELQRKRAPLKRAVSETGAEVRAAVELLMRELHEGYVRIREILVG